jgi:hypothetical protein
MASTSTSEKHSQESHTGTGKRFPRISVFPIVSQPHWLSLDSPLGKRLGVEPLTDLILQLLDTDIKMDTMSAEITGRKRPHSPSLASQEGQDVEEPTSDETQTASIPIPTSTPIRALLLHFNTVTYSKQAICHSIRKTLSTVLPAADIRQPLSDEHIAEAFAKSPLIDSIARDLALRDLTGLETAHLAECYPRIYFEEGAPLVRLASGAEEFLKDVAALRKRLEDDNEGNDVGGSKMKMAVAVLSNNHVMAEDMLGRLGVRELVDAVCSPLFLGISFVSQKDLLPNMDWVDCSFIHCYGTSRSWQ